jgi:penicillin-binding protein-related factor A (putative recombinase)
VSYTGKQFEKDFERSLCKHIWSYKLRDSGGWSRDTNTRFSTSNICDYIVHNSETSKMYLFELKKTNSVSLPFGNIKDKQIEGLTKASKFNIECGFIANLKGECYYLSIKDFNKFKSNTDRKSIPLTYFKEKGIHIPSSKLKVNYRYDLGEVIK